MKTKNLLLASGIGLMVYVVWKNSKKSQSTEMTNTNALPTSNSLTITPMKDDARSYSRNGIYLGYPTIMKP